MERIIKGLYVGSEKSVLGALEKGYTIVSCCKDGPYSHRGVLKYTTMGAPKDKNYYFVEKKDHLYLNLIDTTDPFFIPDEVIDKALAYIKQHWEAGENILVHCNAGHSRSPSIVFMFLRSIGELPASYKRAMYIFKTLYPPFSPSDGIRVYTRRRFSSLKKEE